MEHSTNKRRLVTGAHLKEVIVIPAQSLFRTAGAILQDFFVQEL